MSLEIYDISKKFGDVKALDLSGVSLKIDKGEIFVVIGPSGSGKTTFLRCIAGLETPDSGRIILNKKVLFDSRERINVPPEKRNMGFVPQTWGLWPHLKVFDNIAFGLNLRKTPKDEIRKRVIHIASMLRIEELLDRYPWQLSGGQQQRVALARALVLEPSLLLLDEPISNLDAALRDEARIWLKNVIKTLNITAIYVTHDIREAFAFADRIMVLSKGIPIKIAKPNKLIEEIDNEVVASLLGMNILKGRVVNINNDTAEVSLDGEILISCRSSNKNIKKGQEVIVYIHPRDIKIMPKGFAAKIVSTIFTGTYYEILIKINDISIKAISDEPINSTNINIVISKCHV
jgi:ABC-type sugar transport system ATPase subunit